MDIDDGVAGDEARAEEEVEDEAQGFGGEGFLDEGVFVGRTGEAVLEEVVEARKGVGLGLGTQLFDALEDGVGEDLAVAVAVQRQHRHLHLGEVAGGVEGEEGLHPGDVELLLDGVGHAFAEVDAVDFFFRQAVGVAEDDGLEVLGGVAGGVRG